jgi:hypothetical protein
MKHCTICQQDVTTVGQVRGCSKCHQTGAAAGMHASHADTDPIENAMAQANPGSLPFVDCTVEHAEEGVIAKVKRAYNRVAARATKKK